MLTRTTSSGLLFTVIIAMSVGCNHGQLYQASSLPPEFMAPRFGSVNDVDLSRFARSVGNSQVLYPGDVVEIEVATGIETKEDLPAWPVRISDAGTANIPLIGSVQLAGLEVTRAERVIRDESIRRGKFVDPKVSVLIKQRKFNRVTVVGAVETPATYEISASSCDVLAAIVRAGGVSSDAGTLVEIRHPPREMLVSDNQPYGPQRASLRSRQRLVSIPARTVRVDLLEPRANEFDLSLLDGSTVMVMRKPKRFIHVIGLVRKADQYELTDEQELRLLDAIALAGGRTLQVADKVHVVRHVPGRIDPVVIEASFGRAKRDLTSNIRLAAGDVVSVEETATTFVVGTVKDFVRFGFSSAIPGI